ncbi:MAG TPA: tetratricopeptide repeat protein, partial [Bryobacteraceae bacterium]|nr:tetratricopeptide repeat protein [Bryobacteraceae bacterium]
NRHSYWGNLGIYTKWIPGGEAESSGALTKAVELAEKALEVSPNDYNVRANLAEYCARLGDNRRAMKEIDRIPETARSAHAAQLVIAYELTGRRNEAIQLIVSGLKTDASLNVIKNDPDLRALWADAKLQRSLAARTAATPP